MLICLACACENPKPLPRLSVVYPFQMFSEVVIPPKLLAAFFDVEPVFRIRMVSQLTGTRYLVASVFEGVAAEQASVLRVKANPSSFEGVVELCT
jgi:hypothetical protein